MAAGAKWRKTTVNIQAEEHWTKEQAEAPVKQVNALNKDATPTALTLPPET